MTEPAKRRDGVTVRDNPANRGIDHDNPEGPGPIPPEHVPSPPPQPKAYRPAAERVEDTTEAHDARRFNKINDALARVQDEYDEEDGRDVMASALQISTGQWFPGAWNLARGTAGQYEGLKTGDRMDAVEREYELAHQGERRFGRPSAHAPAPVDEQPIVTQQRPPPVPPVQQSSPVSPIVMGSLAKLQRMRGLTQ